MKSLHRSHSNGIQGLALMLIIGAGLWLYFAKSMTPSEPAIDYTNKSKPYVSLSSDIKPDNKIEVIFYKDATHYTHLILKEGKSYQPQLIRLLSNWAAESPNEALNFSIAIDQPKLRQMATLTVFSKWMKTDRDQATWTAMQVTEKDLQPLLIRKVADAAYQDHPQVLLDWIETLKDYPDIHQIAQQAFIDYHAEADTEGVINWLVRQSPETISQEASSKVFSDLTAQSPETTSLILRNLPDANPWQSALLAYVEVSASISPTDTANLLNAMPWSEAQLDPAVAVFAQNIAHLDEEAAYDWSATIQSDALREETIEAITGN